MQVVTYGLSARWFISEVMSRYHKNDSKWPLEEAQHLSTLLEPIWKLFNSYGSLRVISAAAEIIGLIKSPSLPLPLQPLNKSVRNHLNIILKELKFTV